MSMGFAFVISPPETFIKGKQRALWFLSYCSVIEQKTLLKQSWSLRETKLHLPPIREVHPSDHFYYKNCGIYFFKMKIIR